MVMVLRLRMFGVDVGWGRSWESHLQIRIYIESRRARGWQAGIVLMLVNVNAKREAGWIGVARGCMGVGEILGAAEFIL